MDNWMRTLAAHYEHVRRAYPENELLVVFDIDGTILDMRHLILQVLAAFDRHHGTRHAEHLAVSDIDIHHNRLEGGLRRLGLESAEAGRVADFYHRYRWSTAALLDAHRPFRGVLEVIRYFQLQPRTQVALNSGRPEALRLDTLRSLNRLGGEYRVHFASDMLQLNPDPAGGDVAAAKVTGIQRLRERGFRIVAVVDNEPANLAAVVDANPDAGILPLHATTLFESKRLESRRGTVRGHHYDLPALITGDRLPRHVQFVWADVGSEVELQRFLASEIRWAACVVEPDPNGGIRAAHPRASSLGLPLERILSAAARRRRRIRLDVTNHPALLDQVLASASNFMEDQSLWLAGTLDGIGLKGFRRLAEMAPEATIECRVDPLAPLAVGAPTEAIRLIDTLREAGVNRFALSWSAPHRARLLDLLDARNSPVHIDGVPDLAAFLRACLLQPRSLAAGFDFHDWRANRAMVPTVRSA